VGCTAMATARRAEDVTAAARLLAGACSVLLILIGCGKPSADETLAPRAGQQVGAASSPDRPGGSGGEPQAVAAPAAASLVDPPKPSRSTPTPSSRQAQTETAQPQQTDATSSPVAEKERKERSPAEEAQWQAWYTAARESPEVSVRLQALEHWAQRPSEAFDPVTYGLVDEDEQVRTRAQDLYQQQLTREAAEAVPIQEEQPRPPAE
jgi:hypothetical protein